MHWNQNKSRRAKPYAYGKCNIRRILPNCLFLIKWEKCSRYWAHACLYIRIWCNTYCWQERKKKKFHLLYRYASYSAAGFSDLISALGAVSFDSRHHKTLFCHNLYFTSFLQYIFHYSLWSLCAHVCGIEFTIGNVLLSTMPFPYPAQQAIHHWIHSALPFFRSCCASFLHSSSGWISFLLPYLIHLPNFYLSCSLFV